MLIGVDAEGCRRGGEAFRRGGEVAWCRRGGEAACSGLCGSFRNLGCQFQPTKRPRICAQLLAIRHWLSVQHFHQLLWLPSLTRQAVSASRLRLVCAVKLVFHAVTTLSCSS